MYFTIILSFVFLIFISPFANAEVGWREGAVSHRKLPPPGITESYVRLDVPHIRQGENLCVPTSAAMVVQYFGGRIDPVELKAIAEGHKPKSQRNSKFTYWRDANYALRKYGYRWKIRDYPKSSSGFKSGLRDIKASLRKGRPVLIDVHQDEGHTFVVMGFNDEAQVVYIRDPNLPGKQSRILSYAVLKENWHNHRFANNRSAFFAYPK